ncbi:tryptophan 7-halogenase [Aquisalinus flavus]|uniref:Tryptophan halogenase n=1 Tax=Aquisalinus flavus TaxID=1526572 RepID=A0A8J2V4V3_9PROT|nr:tryptophan 7-halogenase [Aquisalinus flavus]MBD0425766.1 tryptophan 7-halogenase [Aquisalinus flavus]UNE48626.1 tryptophan 7-halogenase [Aquisalinus flavus]GGD13473.1 tryptophan halogenase [Aquisalinus flavus]
MSKPVETIVIVGRDAALWLTALGLQRAYGRAGVEIKAIELPTLLQPHDVLSALPTASGLHGLLGIAENNVFRFAGASYALGQRFAGWSGSRPPFMHAYDSTGTRFGHVDFVHFWQKARLSGMNVPFENFSIGAVAAAQGRIADLRESATPFSKASQGFNLDALSYVHLLKAYALKSGIAHTQGLLQEVTIADGAIGSVALSDGSVHDGDLFVDATGPEAALIGQLGGAAPDSWDHLYPCNRMMALAGEPLSPLPSYSQVQAFRGGWLGMFPLQGRTALVAVYADDELSDDDMMETVPVLSSMTVSGNAVVSTLNTGLRRDAWVGNCIAMGDAAVQLEPLDAVSLHSLHIGLSLLVDHFPGTAGAMPEARLYNRKFASHMENIRDFQLAHYRLNQRYDEPVWDRARHQETPERLAYKLGTFKATGQVPDYDDETFDKENWISIMIGHNHLPDQYHPLVDGVAEAELMQRFQAMLNFIAEEVSEMTSLSAHMELYAPQKPRSSF